MMDPNPSNARTSEEHLAHSPAGSREGRSITIVLSPPQGPTGGYRSILQAESSQEMIRVTGSGTEQIPAVQVEDPNAASPSIMAGSEEGILAPALAATQSSESIVLQTVDTLITTPALVIQTPEQNTFSTDEASHFGLRSTTPPHTQSIVDLGSQVQVTDTLDVGGDTCMSVEESETTLGEAPLKSETVSPKGNGIRGTPKPWKPLTLRLRFLVPFLLFQLGIIAGIVSIQIHSARNSGLTTISLNDSWAKHFVWAYLPTGIALAVGICWSALDLDIVRTEPYVHLSRVEGAEIGVIFDRSLLNPFTGLWSIMKSIRPTQKQRGRKYTTIVYISVTAHILSLFILPPLQSSLFSTSLTRVHVKSDSVRMPAFNSTHPMGVPDGLKLNTFAMASFSGVSLPKSVSVFSPLANMPAPMDGYYSEPAPAPRNPIAVLPVRPLTYFSDNTAIWYSRSTAYRADLQCSPANVSRLISIDADAANKLASETQMINKTRINYARLQYPVSAIFEHLGDRGGCTFRLDVPLARGWDPVGGQTDPWFYGGGSFLNPTDGYNDTSCNEYLFFGINQVNITYTRSLNPSFDFEAAFATKPSFKGLICQSHYRVAYELPVQFGNRSIAPDVTVNVSDFEGRAKDIAISIFNSTEFEGYLFQFGNHHELPYKTDSAGQPTDFQIFFNSTMFWLQGFAPSTLTDWLDTSVLYVAVESFLQGTFVEAIQIQATGWDTGYVEKQIIWPQVVLQRLLVNQRYANASSAILGLLAVCTLLILFFGPKRQTFLPFDPASIASTVSLASDSASLKKLYRGQGLSCAPFDAHVRLRLKPRSEGISCVFIVEDTGGHKSTARTDGGSIVSESVHRHKRPFILKRMYLHLGLLAFTIAILCVVITLWTVGHFRSGLTRGSFYIKLDSVNELAWTILPVLAVISVKFCWSMVDTHFRLLQPYISLSRNSSNAPSTILTSYQTPAVGWITVKAFSNKNYMLGIITAISLCNEILILGIGAFAKSQTVAIASEKTFLSTTALRTAAIQFPNTLELRDLGATAIVPTSYGGAQDVVLASYKILGGDGANWTTNTYAFNPLQFPDNTISNELLSSGSANLSVTTTGIRAEAHCSQLEVPDGIFDKFVIPQSMNDSDGPMYSYEFRDWSLGNETVQNSIVFEESLFRVPPTLIGSKGWHNFEYSGLSYTKRFWGPLWQADISTNGAIKLKDLDEPGPVDYNLNHTRDSRTLPEISKEGHQFVAGWVQYSRSQYHNTSIWYSPMLPNFSFIGCNPTFQQVSAKVILNAKTQQIVDYEIMGPSTPVERVDQFSAVYKADNITAASAGFGTAFLLRTLFKSEAIQDFGFIYNDVFSDSSTLVSIDVLHNKSSLVEGTNLLESVETTFPILFSQWAAVPDNVFVNITDNASHSVTGHLVQPQTRIIFSTGAMVIVVTCLTLLIMALAALPWWTKSWEKDLVHLKREPDVLGAVLGYVCDSSRLMALFQGQNFRDISEMKAFLKNSGKKFRIGKFINGGVLYYGIDVEDETEWVEDIHEVTQMEEEIVE